VGLLWWGGGGFQPQIWNSPHSGAGHRRGKRPAEQKRKRSRRKPRQKVAGLIRGSGEKTQVLGKDNLQQGGHGEKREKAFSWAPEPVRGTRPEREENFSELGADWPIGTLLECGRKNGLR